MELSNLKIGACRYYNDNSQENYNSLFTDNEKPKLSSFTSGDFLLKSGNGVHIKKIGIQTLPGTKLFFNRGSEHVIVGFTGILEVDLTNSQQEITMVNFSQDSMELIRDGEGAYLIIDFLYEE